MKKKWITCLVLVAFLGACSGSADNQESGGNVVNVYNWSDYIDTEVLDLFEAETGIRVNYDVYDSAAVVDVKLLTGSSGYDVVVHANRNSSLLVPIGIYEKLDMSRFEYLGNLDAETWERIDIYDAVRGYYVPYHWGTTGYAWNVDLVRERLPDHPMDSADVLFDPDVVAKLADCGVTLLDSTTSLFPMALAYLGLEPADMSIENIAAAEATLRQVQPHIRYFSNEKMTLDLPNKEVCVAMSWSGDYAAASRRAREAGVEVELRYTAPKEGTGIWVDGAYILSDAPHKSNAYRFVDFLMRADVAAINANEIFYANVNRESWPLISPDILNDPAIYPDEETWQRIYPIATLAPKEMRAVTRAHTRVKSGL